MNYNVYWTFCKVVNDSGTLIAPFLDLHREGEGGAFSPFLLRGGSCQIPL